VGDDDDDITNVPTDVVTNFVAACVVVDEIVCNVGADCVIFFLRSTAFADDDLIILVDIPTAQYDSF
jgi:hypothetical protein